MKEQAEFLALARRSARQAAQLLCEAAGPDLRQHEFSSREPREVKALADRVLEQAIIGQLRPTGIAILSEEAGALEGTRLDGLRFIVDPLDGTANFVRDLGPSAVSIALWERERPVFGVICVIPGLVVAWGGPALGAWFDDRPIRVSQIEDRTKAILCTGLPARLDIDDPAVARRFMAMANRYAKVRMLGAASLSLLHVARGAAEAYFEEEIMVWDVAAGLALVEGAGGRIHCLPGRHPHALDVSAGNGRFGAP